MFCSYFLYYHYYYYSRECTLNFFFFLNSFYHRFGSEQNLFVRVGSNYTTTGGSLVKVKNSTCHDDFNFDTYDYDICLLELEEPLKFNDNIQPVELAEEEPKGGEIGIVAGWGTLSVKKKKI